MSGKQKGIATLFVTSMLLAATLLLVLASYKGVFYQIKRASNELSARQHFWQAQGALECVLSAARLAPLLWQQRLGECQELGQSQIEVTQLSHQVFSIVAKSGFATVSQTLKLATPSNPSSVQASSHLYLANGLVVSPEPHLPLDDAEWACSILRYRGALYLHGEVQNHGLSDIDSPYAGFGLMQSCSSKYQTELSLTTPLLLEVGTTSIQLEQDIRYEPNLASFESLFGVLRAQWFEVMARREFFKIAAMPLTTSGGEMLFSVQALPESSLVSDCGERIEAALQSGENLIWVYGSCHLDNDDLFALEQASQALGGAEQGVILVVHGGVMSLSGDGQFYGLLYHLVEDSAAFDAQVADDWQAMTTEQYARLENLVAGEGSLELDNVAYFSNGEWNVRGGLVLDTPSYWSLYAEPLTVTLDKDLLNAPLSRLVDAKWREGSWYAK